MDHAYAIVSTYNRMRLALAQYSESDCVTINLGSIPVMPQYGITDAIIEFRTLHPKIHFNLIESESAQVVNGLRKMESDFAILRTDYLDPTIYDMTPLVNDRLIILMSEKHPMAKRSKLKLAELKDEKFIVPTIYSDLHTICINACLKAGFNPNICYTVSGKPEITFDFVRKNEAISLAMEKVMGYFPMSGCKLIPLEEDIYSKTALVWLKSVEMNSACRLFKNYLMYRMHA
ncbi:MAG: LysR family transcriptional regulator substrate-binding protein [Clostridia bacterium]